MWRCVFLVVLSLLFVATPSATVRASASTDGSTVTPDLVVTSDTQAGRTMVVTSAADSGPGTLRQALEDQRPYDTITFDPTVFPPDGPVRIEIATELPHIHAGNMTIDGSDSGVVLDGRDVAGDWTIGLMVVSDANAIRGLQVSRFPGPGIAISASVDNIIGGDRSVGAGPFGQGNLVTRNYAGIGLWSDGVIGASRNDITGNLVGADGSGRKGHGNHIGVMVVEGAHHNTIGPGNVITRNEYAGVRIDDLATVGNAVTRNRIHHNGGPGVALHRGGHAGMVAPTVLSFDLGAGTLTGATCPGCTVEVYSGRDDEGESYEDSVTADAEGWFSIDDRPSFAGPHLTATATDPNRGTSEFSLRTTGAVGQRSIQRGNDRLATQLEQRPSSELADNRMGAQFDSFGLFDTYDHEVYPRGVKQARIAITGMEPELVDWSRSEFEIHPGQDALIDRLVENGVDITYVLMFWDRETWPGGEGAPCARFRTKREVKRYLEFVRFIVGHFKDRIDEYEIWNEPDIEGYCPKYIRVNDYVRLVKRVVPVIKAEHPDARVVVGGVSSMLYPAARDWLFDLLESDAMPLVDVISWHPMYGTSPAVKQTRTYYQRYPSIVRRIKRRAEANGFDGEYRANEMGWATPWTMGGGHPRAYSPTVAAKYYGRGILLHLGMDIAAGVPGDNHVIRNLATLMAGAEPADVDVAVRTKANDVASYAFSTPEGGHLVALWTDGVAVESDPGKKAGVTIAGVDAGSAAGIDILHGYEQPLAAEDSDGSLMIRGLLIKDYPTIIRIGP